MRGLAILVNVFLPGVGTLMVGKIGEGIAQIILYWFGLILCFTVVGMIVGLPLMLGVWIWGLVSAAGARNEPQQVVIHNVVAGHGSQVTSGSGTPPSGTEPRF